MSAPRRIIAATLCLLLSACASGQRVVRGNLVLDGIPEFTRDADDPLFRYLDSGSTRFVDWLPSGEGMLVSARVGETSQLHILERPLGERRQITFFDDPLSGARFSSHPDHEGFLFLAADDGDEDFQIHYFDMESRAARRLTDGRSRNTFALWSNSGDRFAYSSTGNDGRNWDIVIADPDDPAAERILVSGAGTLFPLDWSPDDRNLLVTRFVSSGESNHLVVDVETGAQTPILPIGGPSDEMETIAFGGGVFSGDGKGIYLTSDEGSDFRHLRYYDLVTGRTTALSAHRPWDVTNFELSADGRYLAYVTNEEGYGALYLLDLADGTERPITGSPSGLAKGLIVNLRFNRDSRRLAVTVNTPLSPASVLVHDIETGRTTPWTQNGGAGAGGQEFVEPELIHYPTFDVVGGEPRRIPAFVYKPRSAEAPAPVLILIHGGPEGQFRPGYSGILQYWVKEMGIAVIAPNVRGSTGYGKHYVGLDNGIRREESVRDIGALLDWIATQPDLDSGRVLVQGASYGGYMVMASLIHYGDKLRGGVELEGISNFVSFLKRTRDYRRDSRRAEYGDERDKFTNAFLRLISPVNYGEKFTKPLFIVHGENDPRVPPGESEKMLKSIRRHGGTAWFLLIKDEGHGLTRKSNREFYFAAVAEFFRRYLLN